MKALHPSDPTASVDGLPDESAVPSVLLGYQTTQTIYAPTGTVGTWGTDMSLLPHPIVFGSFNSSDSGGTHTFQGVHVNPQLAGANHQEKMIGFLKTVQRWRLAYMSATVYQDAAALTNQGTVAACQYPAEPMLGQLDDGAELWNGEAIGPTQPVVRRLVMTWRKGDMPDFDVAQGMPNAYFGNSRDGVYMPLKLTRSCQKWRSEANCYVNGGMIGTAEEGNYPAAYEDFLRPNGPTQSAVEGSLTLPLTANVDYRASWPFWGDYTTEVGALPPITMALEDVTHYVLPGIPWVTSELCNDTIGAICFRNLDPSTRLTVFYRVGFECQVQPGTTLTPLQKLSPPFDDQAIQSYFAIARELKDAHPADFNDLGKIWDVISSVGKTVLPMLPVPGIQPIAGAALAMGDRIRRGLETGRNPPSMADRQVAESAVHEAMVKAPKAVKAKTAKSKKAGPRQK